MNDALWTQFRRLLLGTVAEAVVQEGLTAELTGMELRFDDDSIFQVPRLNNRMRFHGLARLRAPDPGAAKLGALQARLRRTWPELLAVVDIPVGDRLDNERNDVQVGWASGVLEVRFDLEAD